MEPLPAGERLPPGPPRPPAPPTVADRPSPGEYPQEPQRFARSTLRERLRQSRMELRKVAWPSLGQVLDNSALVLMGSAVATAVIFGVDVGLSKAASSIFG